MPLNLNVRPLAKTEEKSAVSSFLKSVEASIPKHLIINYQVPPMKKSLLEVYALAVCFFSVACFVISAGFGLYDVVQIFAPEFTMPRYQYEQLTSNESYRASPLVVGKSEAERNALSEAEITKRRTNAYSAAVRSQTYDGAQGLLRMFIIMFVDSLAFAIHWRIAKNARQSKL